MVKHSLSPCCITCSVIFHLNVTVCVDFRISCDRKVSEYELGQIHQEAGHVMSALQRGQSLRVCLLLILNIINKLLLSEVKVEVPYFVIDDTFGGFGNRSDEFNHYVYKFVFKVGLII